MQDWRTRIFQLAEALFQSIHMQLSVPLYYAQSETRGANLDGLDYPLNDRPWLLDQMARIRALTDEDAPAGRDRKAGALDRSRPGRLLRGPLQRLGLPVDCSRPAV